MREVHTETVFRGEDGKLYKSERLTRSTVRRSDLKNNQSWGLLKIVAIVLLLAMFIGAVTGAEDKTFSSFLQMLQNVPTINTEGIFTLLDFNLGDWGEWFNFIRDFILMFLSLIEVLIWLGACLWNGATFGLYFLRWVFV